MVKSPRPAAASPRSLGGQLWLDLVNTQMCVRGAVVDSIGTPRQLLAWSRRAGLDTRLLPKSDVAGAHGMALRLRGHLRALAERIAASRAPDPGIVGALNEILGARLRKSRLLRQGAAYRIVETDEGSDPRGWLVPVARSAAEFLAEGDFSRLHRCQNSRCIVYFYATNPKRRFCSPALCGNRAKVAAFLRRKREAGR